MTVTDGYYVVAKLWPVDGPHDSRTVASAADALSALVRYLNNATQPGNAADALACGLDVFRVLSGVATAVAGLDQLLRQVCDRLAVMANDPAVYDDRRDRPGSRTASDASAVLSDARRVLEWSCAPLEQAARLTGHLGHD